MPKFAPLVYELQRRKLPFFTIHTGQHNGRAMNDALRQELALPAPAYQLHHSSSLFSVGDGAPPLAQILGMERPDVVLVQGDTNSTLAGALAAKAAGVKLAHVEAGLRGGETFTREEQNTIRIAQLANFHFAPCLRAVANLRLEGVADSIYFVGNTIVDITLRRVEQLREGEVSAILHQYSVTGKRFVLFTTHKAEIVDEPANLRKICEILQALARLGLPILLPLHPRTQDLLIRHGVALPEAANLHILPPLSYRDFLVLEKEALCLITDGGGVQEECCALGTPVLVIKNATQRPCVVDVGAATICGLDPERLVWEVQALLAATTPRRWVNPFGKGDAAQQIIALLEKQLASPTQATAAQPSSWAEPTFPGGEAWLS